MAPLVFKIKFQNTLRRLVVSEHHDSDAPISLLTVQELHKKIRDMFSISPSDCLLITYVDTENDVVTIAEDQDLVDACLVQRLNPLRLAVEIRQELPAQPSSAPLPEPAENGDLEAFLKSGFPQATVDAIKRFLSWYTDVIDPKLPAAELLRNAQQAFSEYLKNLTRQGAHDGCWAAPFPSQDATRDSFMHPRPSHPRDGFHVRGRCGKFGPSRIFHRGVQCDGCGMHPIEGPRFKSIKVFNYDLCSACFEAMGNETDYQKMELPAYPPPHGFYRPPVPARWARHHMGSPGHKFPFRMHPANFPAPDEVGKKLDARFVRDVTIFDGTELTPGTKFTKIWRLRNSGTIPWPQNIQLVHIGGDALSSEEAVNVELPEGGLPCGDDIEASVDLVAPEKAGRYVSHWRLTSPSGQKFGHRIWVMIQVVPHGEQSPQLQESLSAEKETKEREEAMIPNTKKGKEKLVEPHDTPVPENMDIEERNIQAPELQISNDSSNAIAYTIADENPPLAAEKPELEQNNSSVVYPEVDGFSVVEKPTEIVDWFNVLSQEIFETKPMSSPDEQAAPPVQEQFAGNSSSEVLKTSKELQLLSLESMGFKECDLNASLMEKNKFNFQHTLDDLVALASWDDMVKDLQEMGFEDIQTIKLLLIKNKGSIKHVVKDLVEMEKLKAGVKVKSV